jgi:membrane-bound lytic murein transglycosylase B
MVRSAGGRSRRVRRPAHAQPSALAPLRWSSVLESVAGLGALVVMAAAVAGGGGTNPAAAVEPVPADSQGSTSLAVPLGWQLQTPFTTSAAGSASAHGGLPTPRPPTDFAVASALAADGIPLTALQAYQSAAVRQNLADPGCHLPWPLLAAIGRVESDHGRFGGAVLHTDGLSAPHVIGIPLDGHGTALIRDTDKGRLDGDRVYDRAVGPMQFIPSTWAAYAVDGNSDGVADPFNIFDATAAAARYLCTAGGDLATSEGQERAVLAYNHSAAYLTAVLHLEAIYAAGVPGLSVPIIPTSPLPAVPTDIPPVNPGPPPSITPTTSATEQPATTAPSGRAASTAPAQSGPAGSSGTSGGATSESSSPSQSSSRSTSSSPSCSTPSATPPSSTTASSSTGASSSTATSSSPAASPPATSTPATSTPGSTNPPAPCASPSSAPGSGGSSGTSGTPTSSAHSAPTPPTGR